MVQAQIQHQFTVTLKAGAHEWLSDVSKELGGLDEGANPHELLEAALAACTCMTMQMYARRKNWPVQGILVTARILEEKPTVKIQTDIQFDGSLSPEQRQRLYEIACKCPIHRILERPIQVENKMVEVP